MRRIWRSLAGFCSAAGVAAATATSATAAQPLGTPTAMSITQGTSCGSWYYPISGVSVAVASCIYRNGSQVQPMTTVWNGTSASIRYTSDQKVSIMGYGLYDTLSPCEYSQWTASPGSSPGYCLGHSVTTSTDSANIAKITVFTPWGNATVTRQSPYA